MSGGEGAHWRHLHRLANSEFDFRIRQILPEYWTAATPCEEWDVHDLVEHVVRESLWVPAILESRPRAETEAALSGDLLEGDPADVWEFAHRAAIEAFEGFDLDREVALDAGSTTGLEFLRQRVADLTVHAWDLARTLTVDEDLDPALVAAVHDWALPRFTGAGPRPDLFYPPIGSAPDTSPRDRLLHLFGRDPA